MKFIPNSVKIIPLNKGVNQNVSNLELGAAELIQCVNYELVDGNYAGLRVIDGYEKYDGTEPYPSQVGTYKDINNDIIQTGDQIPYSVIGNYPEWTFTPKTPDEVDTTVLIHGEADVGQTTPQALTNSISGGPTLSQFDVVVKNAVTKFAPTSYGFPLRSEANISFTASTNIYAKELFYYETTAWVHYAEVATGTEKVIYIDGVEDSRVDYMGPLHLNGDLVTIDRDTIGGSTATVLLYDEIRLNPRPTYLAPFTPPAYPFEYSVAAYENGDQPRVDTAAAITKPTSGTSPILAVFEFAGYTWCIKADEADGNKHKMYKATTSGWGTGTLIDATLAVGLDTQVYKYYKGRIQNYNENAEIMIFCNGISKPFILEDDGTIVPIDSLINVLPSDTGFTGTKMYPTIPVIWNERIILAYPEGNLFFDHPGYDPVDPTNNTALNNAWDAGDVAAGTKYFEDEITNLIIAPSSCIVFCEHMIKALKLSNIDPVSGVDFTVDTFSDRSGALWNTAQRILGRILFCNDRGVSTLVTTDAYGDFEASIITKNIQKTYDIIKDEIIGTAVNRERNQYRVSTPSTGFTITFKADKSIKGVTTHKYPDNIKCCYECRWAGAANGYVFRVDEDVQAFDEDPILSYFKTSYFTYNAPTNFKQFKKMLFELEAEQGTVIETKNLYDYSSTSTVSGDSEDFDSYHYYQKAIWGDSTWGSFVWGGTDQEREPVYLFGIGSNMSIQIRSNEKYRTPHLISNVIVTYSQRKGDF